MLYTNNKHYHDYKCNQSLITWSQHVQHTPLLIVFVQIILLKQVAIHKSLINYDHFHDLYSTS